MNELIDLALNSPYGQYVLAACLICRIFVTVAPMSLTKKIPNAIMVIISAMALASNKKADNKGNPL